MYLLLNSITSYCLLLDLSHSVLIINHSLFSFIHRDWNLIFCICYTIMNFWYIPQNT